MPLFTSDIDKLIMNEIDSMARYVNLRPLILGSSAGVSGGAGGRPGGFIGQLSQKKVAFDTSEGSSPNIPTGVGISGSSLLHNLNRIRGGWSLADNSILPRHVASGILTVSEFGNGTFEEVAHILFSGVNIYQEGTGKIVVAIASGGGGGAGTITGGVEFIETVGANLAFRPTNVHTVGTNGRYTSVQDALDNNPGSITNIQTFLLDSEIFPGDIQVGNYQEVYSLGQRAAVISGTVTMIGTRSALGNIRITTGLGHGIVVSGGSPYIFNNSITTLAGAYSIKVNTGTATIKSNNLAGGDVKLDGGAALLLDNYYNSGVDLLADGSTSFIDDWINDITRTAGSITLGARASFGNISGTFSGRNALINRLYFGTTSKYIDNETDTTLKIVSGTTTISMTSGSNIQINPGLGAAGLIASAGDGSGYGFLAGAASDVQWYRGASNTWQTPDSVIIDVNAYISGQLGIGTTAVPVGSIGGGKLFIHGLDSNLNGPRVQFTTASDNYPGMTWAMYSHDDLNIAFDAYWDGTNWKSSDAGSNFAVFKYLDTVRIYSDTGIAQGNTITWDTIFILNPSGQLALPITGSSAGILIGGDVQWYRDSANVWRTPDSVAIDTRLAVGTSDTSIAQLLSSGNDTYIPGWFVRDYIGDNNTNRTSLVVSRTYSSGAGAANIGANILWQAKGASALVNVAQELSTLTVVTAGAEYGYWQINTVQNGSLTREIRAGTGVTIGTPSVITPGVVGALVATKEIYSHDDEWGLGERIALSGFAGLTPTEEFASSKGALSSWAGAPFATPSTESYATPSVMKVYDSSTSTRCFAYKTVSVDSSSNVYQIIRVHSGFQVSKSGVRIDDGSDSNYVELFLRTDGLGGTTSLIQSVSGSETTLISGLPDAYYTLRLNVIAGNVYAYYTLNGRDVRFLAAITAGRSYTITRIGVIHTQASSAAGDPRYTEVDKYYTSV